MSRKETVLIYIKPGEREELGTSMGKPEILFKKSEDQRGVKSCSTISRTAEAAAANSGLPPASSEQTNSL